MKGFKYHKLKEEVSTSDSWGSYSDLFMVLSFVFLMMYVVASLRTGTSSIHEKIEKKKLGRENQELRAQIKAYNTLKDQALKEETPEEQQVYQDLMGKLSLLEEKAKAEKVKLRQEALDREQKEMALNNYQQIVKSIIDANLLAKNKLQVREEIIEKKNDELKNHKAEITQNNVAINEIQSDLKRKIEELSEAQRTFTISRDSAKEQIAKLQALSQDQINKLSEKNRLAEAKAVEVARELAESQSRVSIVEQEKIKLKRDLASSTEKLEMTVKDYEKQIGAARAEHLARIAEERKTLEKNFAEANLSSKEKQRQLEEFNQRLKENEQQVQARVNELQAALSETKNRELEATKEKEKLSQKLTDTVSDYKKQITDMQASYDLKMAKDKVEFQDKLRTANISAEEKARQLVEYNKRAKLRESAHASEVAKLKENLTDAQTKAQARVKLSRDISSALHKAGVEASVDPETGDVVITFGKDFFDKGSADLKPSMKEVLQKFIPKYSESLLRDPEIARKISSVEIIGFASPTYRNKYVDPNSLDAQDQGAAKYNLDLSFRRARSIYDYIFDTKTIRYTYQKDLLAKVKVSGRSFFSEDRAPAGVIPGMPQSKFCELVDCKQAQRVIIKFNLDEKNVTRSEP